jgi:hypothetical protein
MSQYTWKDQGFRIAGAGTSVLTDISASINQVSVQAAITDLDTTGLGATSHSRVNGLANDTLSINGFWNGTTEAIFGPLMAGTSVTKRFEHKVKASTRFYNGYALPTNIQPSGNQGALQLFSATLVVTGAMNRTSVALT